jgi:hypothetical protein
MDLSTTIALVVFPLAAFFCALVATWWCLFQTSNQEQPKIRQSESRGPPGIAKTASKEESDCASPNVDIERSDSLTDDFLLVSIGPITQQEEQESKGSSRKQPRAIFSNRWTSGNKQIEKKVAQDLADVESAGAGDEGFSCSVDNEELTLDHGIDDPTMGVVAKVNLSSPTKAIKKLFQSMSVQELKNAEEVPNEIFSRRVDVDDSASHPDDEITLYDGLVDDMDRTLGSNDVYTTS